MANKNLNKAKNAKNDEFYTQLKDIEEELHHYKEHFKNKIVYCNCDDPSFSNFYVYFRDNFKKLGLEKLIVTHYSEDGYSYKLEMFKDLTTELTPLEGNGDFRSGECLELLDECDIVVTNPPFSLFRVFVDIIKRKKFLIIGGYNSVTYKDIFKLIKEEEMFLGINFVKEFYLKDGSIKKFGNIAWFTNFKISFNKPFLKLREDYNIEDYIFYDNYDAINVDRLKDVPDFYYGNMGVPITILSKINLDQFKIIRFRKGLDNKDFRINGKDKYVRVIIKRVNLI